MTNLAELENDRAVMIADPPLQLALPRIDAFMLLQVIQLSISHPQMDPGTGRRLAVVAVRIEMTICTGPGLQAAAREGWQRDGMPAYAVALRAEMMRGAPVDGN